ncbi:hypothetical protein LCGC14_2771440 [marine sediment metagenome]|uniref:Uncharacterized protein n=1 Tax=marine sediment metagenome TaxID=412755 RepID=A0A0F8YW02_9ZZZZ
MIICIVTKNVGPFYTQGASLDAVETAIKNNFALNCWWYNDYGKRFSESVVFMDDEQVLMIRSESDASPLEEM